MGKISTVWKPASVAYRRSVSGRMTVPVPTEGASARPVGRQKSTLQPYISLSTSSPGAVNLSASSLEATVAYAPRSLVMTGAGEARSGLGWYVEPHFLEMLGVRPLLGRGLVLFLSSGGEQLDVPLGLEYFNLSGAQAGRDAIIVQPAEVPDVVDPANLIQQVHELMRHHRNAIRSRIHHRPVSAFVGALL